MNTQRVSVRRALLLGLVSNTLLVGILLVGIGLAPWWYMP